MPKKKKPWYRPRNVLLMVFVAFLAWAGYWIDWAYSVEPEVSVNYAALLEEHCRKHQPSGENGWYDLITVLIELDNIKQMLADDGHDVSLFDRISFDALYEKDLETTAEEIEIANIALRRIEESDIVRKLEAALNQPNHVRPMAHHDGTLIEFLLPELSKCRELAMALCASAWSDLKHGRSLDGAHKLSLCNRMGVALTYQATMIDSLVGSAVLDMTNESVRSGLNESLFDLESLERLWDDFARMRPIIPMSVHIGYERYMVYDIIQRTHTDLGNDDGIFIPAAEVEFVDVSPFSGESRFANLLGPFFPSRLELKQATDDIYDDLVNLAEAPPQERLILHTRFREKLASVTDRHELLGILVPAVEKAASIHDETVTSIAATRLMIAVEQFRLAHGRIPTSISELDRAFGVREFLSVAPFEISYRMLEKDVHARMYQIYCYGLDDTDDNGRVNPDDPHVAFRSEEAMGFDYVYNPTEVKSNEH